MKTLVIFVALLLVLAAGRRLPFKNHEGDHPQKATRLRPFGELFRKFHRDDKKIHGDDLDYNYIYGEDDEEDYGTKLKDEKYEVDDPLYGQHVVRRDADEQAPPTRELTIRSGEGMYR